MCLLTAVGSRCFLRTSWGRAGEWAGSGARLPRRGEASVSGRSRVPAWRVGLLIPQLNLCPVLDPYGQDSSWSWAGLLRPGRRGGLARGLGARAGAPRRPACPSVTGCAWGCHEARGERGRLRQGAPPKEGGKLPEGSQPPEECPRKRTGAVSVGVFLRRRAEMGCGGCWLRGSWGPQPGVQDPHPEWRGPGPHPR